MDAAAHLESMSAVSIGGVQLQTRFGLAPLNSGLFYQDGSPRERCLDFYGSFCSQYVGLISIGGIAIEEGGRANRSSLALDELGKTRGLREITKRAHDDGVAVTVQLEHAGRQLRSSEIGSLPVAASPIPCPVIGEVPRELTIEGIKRIVTNFARSASFVQEAGADFVEVHAAHGYLISGFLSQMSNVRADEYGGTLNNRYRILDQIIDAISRVCSLPVGVRINVQEQGQLGQGVKDVVAGLSGIQKNLSYVSVSAGMYVSNDDVIMPRRSMGKALWRSQSMEIRSALKVPTFLAGNIDSPVLAEELIAAGEADMILFGRALLADPQLIQRSLEKGKVQPCTDCGLCKYHSRDLSSIYCPFHPVLNPRLKCRT